MPPRKYIFGCEKRKKKQKLENFIQSQSRALDKFFGSKKQIESSCLIDEDLVIEELNQCNENDNEDLGVEEPIECLNENDNEDLVNEKATESEDFNVEYGHLNINDPKKQDRKWLVYSDASNKVFCFCCELFKEDGNKTQLVTNGFKDWKNLGHRLRSHETSNEHITCMSKWIELLFKEDGNKTQLATNGFKDWKNLGHRLRSHETSNEHITCMSKWIELEKRLQKNETIDNGVQEQINREREHWKNVLLRIIAIVRTLAKNNLAFCGENEKIYQERNENFLSLIEMVAQFDSMLAGEIKSTIVKRIKEVKYFSVILDCTPDVSHEEQMSLVIRCVDVSTNQVKVEEFFLEFLKVDDTSGLGLFNVIKERWKVFKDHAEGLTLKPLSQTRWESRVESVKAIRYQAPQIRDALNRLANLGEPHNTKSEDESLATYEIENFEFLLGMIIWHNLLFAVNLVSKIFQREDMHIDVAIIQLKGLITFLEKYRETEFLDAMIEAKEVATLMELDPVFREKRVIRRKKQFDENVSEEVTQIAEESFRINYFMYIIDQALSSLKSRFEQFQVYEENFGFLFDLKKLSSTNKECLKTYCVNLEDFLKHDELSDIDGRDLFSELNVLKEVLPEGIKMPIEVLNYLKTMDGCFPNASIVYRILLTIPIIVASGERSFSKLKLIKSYLRPTMSQERLNGLALLSIEKDMVDKFDYASFISDFAAKNVRRVMFM
ncbi:uncharacterized protein LOC114314100 [Camellia sinensis]|uniref:uncharacterized protein LOC114314100 n=1 Tax=Camellia sinensis TaxID=4442 RepID=UPI0010364968|nr:uncharacterized protein LOC114314100 [Camellia sinensis]